VLNRFISDSGAASRPVRSGIWGATRLSIADAVYRRGGVEGTRGSSAGPGAARRLAFARAPGLAETIRRSTRRIPDNWTAEFLPDPLEPLLLVTGPEDRRNPPKMRRGDRVVLHAVGHVRVFAEGQLLSGPKWAPRPRLPMGSKALAVGLPITG